MNPPTKKTRFSRPIQIILCLMSLPLFGILLVPGFWVRYMTHQGRADGDLWDAIEAKKMPAIVAALKAGANPNGGELLVCFNNPEATKALLDAGANPNDASEFDGDTALIKAALFDYPETIRVLLKYGANPNQSENSGMTALHHAINFNGAEVSRCERSVRILLDAGANINRKDNDGRTPLYLACYWDSPEIVRMLLRYHANPNIRAKLGQTPLDVTTESNKARIIAMLREAGAKTSKELDAQAAVAGKH